MADEDIKEIFDNLDADKQEQIRNETLAKMSDERLNLSQDRLTLEKMMELTMVENLIRANYKKIEHGGIAGGDRNEDAINKFFLKCIDTAEKLRENVRPKMNINVEVTDKDTVHEILLGRKKEKIIDAEYTKHSEEDSSEVDT